MDKPAKTPWRRFATTDELAVVEEEGRATKWLRQRLRERQCRIDEIKYACIRRAKGMEAAE